MSMQTLQKAAGIEFEDWYSQNRRFNEAEKVSLNTLEYFAMQAETEHGVAPESDREREEVRAREERMLQRFKVQPWEYYRSEKVRRFARDTWPLEKYWNDLGCPWGGPRSPTVEKAFSINELRGTFPIFYDAFIQAGRLATPILDRLLSDTINVSGKVANHSEFTDTATSPAPGIQSAEGARGEQVTVVWREREIRLNKLIYEVLSTYEATQWARLPILARGLERLGRRFQYLITETALEVLRAGDGSTPSNAPATVAGNGALTDYTHYLDLYFAFPDEYTPDVFITAPVTIRQALTIPEFKDPLAGGAFQNQGRIPTPLGVPFERWRSKGIAGSYANDDVIAVDSTAIGLVEYTAGGVLNEAERLISEGWNKNVTSVWVGFAMIDPDSRVVGTNFS